MLYVGADDVQFYYNDKTGATNLYIDKVFPWGGGCFAACHCWWGNNIGGPRNSDGVLSFRYTVSENEVVPMPSMDHHPNPETNVTCVNITFPIEFDIYSFGEVVIEVDSAEFDA